MNIHSYGNDWIYPFNYIRDYKNLTMKKTNFMFYKFYKDFENKMKSQCHKDLFGNASSTIDYETNGEAGDWLTGAMNILNLDVELGNNDTRSNSFYPPRILIDKIVTHNWIIMKKYLEAHITNL